MKTYGETDVQINVFLTSALDGVVSFTPWPRYPRGKRPRHTLDRKLSRAQNRSGRCRKHFYPYRDSNYESPYSYWQRYPGYPGKLPTEKSGIEMLYEKTVGIVLRQTLQNSNDKHKSHETIEITRGAGSSSLKQERWASFACRHVSRRLINRGTAQISPQTQLDVHRNCILASSSKGQ
jgi:hypothetical protein